MAKQYWQPLFDFYRDNKDNYNIYLSKSPDNGVYEVFITDSSYKKYINFWHLPLSVLSDDDFNYMFDKVVNDYGTFDNNVIELFGSLLVVATHDTRLCFGKPNKNGLDPFLGYFAKHYNVSSINKDLTQGRYN